MEVYYDEGVAWVQISNCARMAIGEERVIKRYIREHNIQKLARAVEESVARMRYNELTSRATRH